MRIIQYIKLEEVKEGLYRLWGITPKIYITAKALTKQNTIKFNNIFIVGPISGSIKEYEGGYIIEEGENSIFLLLGYHVDVLDVLGNCEAIEVTKTFEDMEEVPMNSEWFGGALLILPKMGCDKVKITYTINNGVAYGLVHYKYDSKTKQLFAIYHKIFDYDGNLISNELEKE
jgi:hypothetical protein